MKKVFKAAFCAVFIFSSFFFITEYEAYRPIKSHFIGSAPEPFREKGVYISAKSYDVHDSKAYLDRDLLSMGYRPIQVSIQNNSSSTYFLSDRGLDIPTVEANDVTTSATLRQVPKSIAFKIAGLLFWPFIIPGTIDGIITFKNHREMKRDYYAKSIKPEDEQILPYSSVNRVIFVRADTQIDHFHLHLKTESSRTIHQIVKINS